MHRGWVACWAIGVGEMAILDTHVSVIAGIAVEYCTDHAKVLCVLDFKAAELRTVLDKSNLAFKRDSELHQALEIGLVPPSIIELARIMQLVLLHSVAYPTNTYSAVTFPVNEYPWNVVTRFG